MTIINPEANRPMAVIDLGTNSAKLAIAAWDPEARDIHVEKFLREATRVGEGVAESGEVGTGGQLRAINTIERFQIVIRQFDCRGVFAFSTHAFREARNAADVIALIENETGVPVKVLTPEEEGRFAYIAARRFLRGSRELYLIDVGGGSVEFVRGGAPNPIEFASLPLGALRLTEKYIRSDPIDPRELSAMRREIERSVSGVMESMPLPAPGGFDLVASGGSAVTVQRMINAGAVQPALGGAKLRLGGLRRLLALCAELPLARRKHLPGLEPDRADIIVAGLAVVISVMESAGKRVINVSESGVRDGVLIHLFENDGRW